MVIATFYSADTSAAGCRAARASAQSLCAPAACCGCARPI